MEAWTRRRVLKLTAVAGFSSCLPGALAESAKPGGASGKKGLTLGFGTYGTRGMKTEAAIKLLADTGYDSVELTATEGWDAEQATNGALRSPAQGCNLANSFTCLLGVALSDQSEEGSGNLGLLRGAHTHMAEFFQAQQQDTILPKGGMVIRGSALDASCGTSSTWWCPWDPLR